MTTNELHSSMDLPQPIINMKIMLLRITQGKSLTNRAVCSEEDMTQAEVATAKKTAIKLGYITTRGHGNGITYHVGNRTFELGGYDEYMAAYDAVLISKNLKPTFKGEKKRIDVWKDNPKLVSLSKITDKQLIKELKSRGYQGELSKTTTVKI